MIPDINSSTELMSFCFAVTVGLLKTSLRTLDCNKKISKKHSPPSGRLGGSSLRDITYRVSY